MSNSLKSGSRIHLETSTTYNMFVIIGRVSRDCNMGYFLMYHTG